MNSEVWKVFIPCDLLIQSDCFLLGQVSNRNQSVYITASSQQVPDVQSALLNLVGVWKRDSRTSQRQIRHTKPVWTSVWIDHNQRVHCSIVIDHSEVSCTGIIYNPQDLLQSSVLMHNCETTRSKADNITSLVHVLSSIPVYKETPVVRYFGTQQAKTSVVDYFVRLIVWITASIYLPFRWLTVEG